MPPHRRGDARDPGAFLDGCGSLALAAGVAGRAGGDVEQPVALGRLARHVARSTSPRSASAAARAPRPTGRRCGSAAGRRRGCRRSRSRRRRARRSRPGTHGRIWSWTGACSRVTATTGPAASLQLLGDVRHARLLAPGAGRPARRRPGRRGAARSRRSPTRRRPTTPQSLASSSWASSAHGTPTPEASSCTRGARRQPVGVPGAKRYMPRRMPSTSTFSGSAGCDDRLVVDRQVVDDVLGVAVAVHPAQAVLDDVARSRTRRPGRRPRRPGWSRPAAASGRRRAAGPRRSAWCGRRWRRSGSRGPSGRRPPRSGRRCAGTRTSSRRRRSGPSARRAWRTTCRPR